MVNVKNGRGFGVFLPLLVQKRREIISEAIFLQFQEISRLVGTAMFIVVAGNHARVSISVPTTNANLFIIEY